MTTQRTSPRSTRALPLALMASLVAGAVAACTPADIISPPTAGAAQLQDFGSCEELLGYFQEHALEQVGPWGLGSASGWGGERGVAVESMDDMAGDDAGAAASDAGGGGDFSGTNNQVQGVEEPDLVQTDGEIIVTVSAGRLVVVDAASATRVGEVELPRPVSTRLRQGPVQGSEVAASLTG